MFVAAPDCITRFRTANRGSGKTKKQSFEYARHVPSDSEKSLESAQPRFLRTFRRLYRYRDGASRNQTLNHRLSSLRRHCLFEPLCPTTHDAVADIAPPGPSCKLMVRYRSARGGDSGPFRRGAHGIVSRAVEPGMLVDCLNKVARGEPWLETKLSPPSCPSFRKD